ncbi:tetratricopeptide repeat protein [Eilatimonas milleporae]|uniref:Sulfotransferase family protein n=1 Tax=Eilatimonas milleporae TaxID=911205 RepID=A0A3M0CQF6_9PROT|nr:sulfotransferase family 2 domain-containing protein [Eilatimonas milleporae]RMB11781.1 sulfotransferase family protein [Eilatimonas milleporae]
MILAYHIAKTGGTTLLHHLRDELGKDACVAYGLHPGMERFFNGQPLWEELPDAEKRQARVLLGHQVSDRLIPTIPADDVIGLFCVWRDPYDHFISQYRHHSGYLAQTGQQVDARAYLKSLPPNRVVRALYRLFRRLAMEDRFSFDAACRVLSQFEFLCVTERLATDLTTLTQRLGVGPVTRRERVSQGQIDLGGLHADDIYEHFRMDMRLYRLIVDRLNGRTEDNPLAFDASLFSENQRRLRQESHDRDAVPPAYEALASFMVGRNVIDAAKLELTLRGAEAPKYAPIWAAHATVNQQRDPVAVALSEKEKGSVYMRHNLPELALSCFEKAIQLNPEHITAHIAGARAFQALGDIPMARRYAEQGLALNPRNGVARDLLAVLEKQSEKALSNPA